MSQLAHYLRRMWRAALTSESLLSAEEAAEALPAPGPQALVWVCENVKIAGEVAGVGVYRWGDVIAAMHKVPASEAPTTWLSTGEAATRLGVSRSTLDAMVVRAPRDLPGAPVHVGDGGRRQHLRWDAGGLDQWIAAYRSWEARERGAKAPVRRSRQRRAPMDREDGPVDWGAVAKQFSR